MVYGEKGSTLKRFFNFCRVYDEKARILKKFLDFSKTIKLES